MPAASVRRRGMGNPEAAPQPSRSGDPDRPEGPRATHGGQTHDADRLSV